MVRTALIGIVIVTVLASYGGWIEPNRLQIKHLQITKPELNRLLEGKTAVHISDLHLNGRDGLAVQVLQALDELQPDFIFLTGDYVAWNGDYQPALAFFAQLQARIGIWAVMGDYDYSNDRQSCLFCHEPDSGLRSQRHPVRFLRNAGDRVEIDGKVLQIAGLEWSNDWGQGSDVEGKWPRREGADASIVLVHNPLAFDTIGEGYGALVLSGDTHGGQINLPLWAWSLLGYEKNRKYNQGLFQSGDSLMHVSSGTGTSHIDFRLGRPPEITILHF